MSFQYLNISHPDELKKCTGDCFIEISKKTTSPLYIPV